MSFVNLLTKRKLHNFNFYCYYVIVKKAKINSVSTKNEKQDTHYSEITLNYQSP